MIVNHPSQLVNRWTEDAIRGLEYRITKLRTSATRSAIAFRDLEAELAELVYDAAWRAPLTEMGGYHHDYQIDPALLWAQRHDIAFTNHP